MNNYSEKEILMEFEKFKSSLDENIFLFQKFSKQKLNKNSVKIIKELKSKLLECYPFYHPFYAGQMLKPPHPIAVYAYLFTMLINPNNHALDGGPSTSYMEKEVVEKIAKMFGYDEYLGHLTSGGTFANLEALWIANQINPDKIFAICENAHYTHTRLSNVLNFKYTLIKQNKDGTIDINHLSDELKKKKIGTVVLTIGTTGLGAIDNIDEVLELKNKYGFRLHLDAAYGGFYKILDNFNLFGNDSKFKRMNEADSIVVDPHKHGLQPYGCGCVLFNDRKIGKFYVHSSPYTYFTSDKLHLGEISLECSRPGASAAALWATLKYLPLDSKNGLYSILKVCKEAADDFYNLIKTSQIIKPLVFPELDIVNYFINGKSTSEISQNDKKLFEQLMQRKKNPIYLSLNKIPADLFRKNYPDIICDSEEVVVLRSVFMKPEHKKYIKKIFSEIEKEIIKTGLTKE